MHAVQAAILVAIHHAGPRSKFEDILQFGIRQYVSAGRHLHSVVHVDQVVFHLGYLSFVIAIQGVSAELVHHRLC